jgi:tetratricopeptide (TPR) repeat protein
MDDFLSNLHDDPEFGEGFGEFLSKLSKAIDKDDPHYQEVVNLDKQYNARTGSNTINFLAGNAGRNQKAQHHLQEASKYFQEKNWARAVFHFSEVLKVDPENSNMYSMRGFCYQSLENKELALKDIDRAIDLNPNNAHAILLRTSYKLQENFDEMIDDLLRYFQRTQENAAPEILVVFANFLRLDDEHWHIVINKLSRFLQIDQTKHVPIGVNLINRVGGEQLFVRLSKLKEFNPDTLFIFKLIFHGLLNKDIDKICNILSKSIKNNPESSTLYYMRSQAHEHKSNWDAALQDINKAIDQDPNGYRYYKKRAEFNLEKGKFTNVLTDYEKYLSLGDDEIEDRNVIEEKIDVIKESIYPDEDLLEKSKDEFTETNYELAKSYHDKGMTMVTGDLKGGINAFQKAINAAPGYAPAYVSMFEVCYQLGEWDRALAYINDAIRINPNDANSYNSRAAIFSILNRLDDAIKDLEKSVNLDPNNIQTLENLFVGYFKQNNWDKALESLNHCINLDPSVPKFYYFRGHVYVNKNMHQKSIVDFEKYCELGGDPQRESLEEIQEKIKNLKESLSNKSQ